MKGETFIIDGVKWEPEGRARLTMDATGAWVPREDAQGDYMILRRVKDNPIPDLKRGDIFKLKGDSIWTLLESLIQPTDGDVVYMSSSYGEVRPKQLSAVEQVFREREEIWTRGAV